MRTSVHYCVGAAQLECPSCIIGINGAMTARIRPEKGHWTRGYIRPRLARLGPTPLNCPHRQQEVSFLSRRRPGGKAACPPASRREVPMALYGMGWEGQVAGGVNAGTAG